MSLMTITAMMQVDPREVGDHELEVMQARLHAKLDDNEREYVRLRIEEAMPHHAAAAQAGLPVKMWKHALSKRIRQAMNVVREQRRRTSPIDRLWVLEESIELFKRAKDEGQLNVARGCLKDIAELEGFNNPQELLVTVQEHKAIPLDDLALLSKINAAIEGETVINGNDDTIKPHESDSEERDDDF